MVGVIFPIAFIFLFFLFFCYLGAQPGIFEGRGGFCKFGYKFLAVLKVKVKCKR